MKPGNKIFLILFLKFIFINISNAEQKITATPLINIDQIKPSFENLDEKNDESLSRQIIKKKNTNNIDTSKVILIGLDKITAKSSEIKISLNEIKKFGPLEIRVLKCGKVKVNNKIDHVAYMQVKDFTKNENEKVFIFNGWTFASNPSLIPFDHAIYDLQLLGCGSN